MEIAVKCAEKAFIEYTEIFYKAVNNLRSADQVFLWRPEESNPAVNCDVLLAVGAVSSQDFAECMKLALIQTVSAGYETVDIEAATVSGIWVSYAPSDRTGNADSVAEFALLLLLALFRRLLASLKACYQDGTDAPVLTSGLKGKCICVVGLGGIGMAIIARLRPFGCRIIAVNRSTDKAPDDVRAYPLSQLKEAVAEADCIILCLRATADNRHLFDEDVLGSMKKGGMLINLARGTLVDEAALYTLIKAGQIRAAGLDVLQNEPPSAHDSLVTLDETLVTPHRAGLTDNSLQGTVQYVDEVLNNFTNRRHFPSLGERPASTKSTFGQEKFVNSNRQ